MKKKHSFAVAVAALALTAAAGLGAAPKPDDAVKYRQGVLFAMGWNVGAMGAMVKGDVPFDAKQFAFLAERVAQLSPMALEGFTPESKRAKSQAGPNCGTTWTT